MCRASKTVSSQEGSSPGEVHQIRETLKQTLPTICLIRRAIHVAQTTKEFEAKKLQERLGGPISTCDSLRNKRLALADDFYPRLWSHGKNRQGAEFGNLRRIAHPLAFTRE